MLSALASLAVAVTALTQADDDIGRNVVESHAFGKTYWSRIVRNVVNQTPPWNDNDENPPVSARRALKLSEKVLRSIAKAPDGWKWKAVNANLLLVEDAPIWFVRYQGISADPTESRDSEHEITLVVLMDGTVIKPVVAEETDEHAEAGEFAPPPTPPVTWGPIRPYIAEDAPPE